MPPAICVRSYRGDKDVMGDDGISIIRGDQNCRLRAHLEDTPKGVSNILLDKQMRLWMDFSELPASAGYKICVCPGVTMVTEEGVKYCPDDVALEQDIRITVQRLMFGVNFKGLVTATLVCLYCTHVEFLNVEVYMNIPLRPIWPTRQHGCRGSFPLTFIFAGRHFLSRHADQVVRIPTHLQI